jgi:hypothetical protein
MSNFVLGVLASIAGGMILLLSARVSRRWRKALVAVSNALAGGDVERVFHMKADAEEDMEQRLCDAKEVAILAGRGNELQRRTFSSMFLHRPEKRQVRIRILLPETLLSGDQYDWASQRESELASFDSSFGNRLLHHQIDTNVAFLDPYVKAGKVELRRFNAPHIGRIVLVDGAAYYAPYRSDAHGRDSKVYRFKAGGEMSENFLRLFEQLWNAE